MRHLKDKSVRLIAVAVMALVWSCGDDLVVPDDANPGAITIVQGGTQTGTAGQALPLDLIVQVTDEVGRPVAQQPLTINLDHGGSITPAQPVTNSQGRAQFQWTLGPGAGTQELSVATGASGPSVTFHGTASSATANVASAVAGNGQSGEVGSPLPDSLVLQVNDEFGNPVSGAAVTWTTSEGSLSPITGLTDGAGLARSRWTLGNAPGAQQTQASVAGISPAVIFSATATAGPTPRLSVQRQPATTAKSGEVLGRQPRIQLQSATGESLATGGVAVTVALSGSAGSVGGTTTAITAGTGRADFTDLVITAPPGSYVLQFTSSGYRSVESDPIVVSAPDPSATLSTVGLSTDSIGAGGRVTLTATIRDRDGAPIQGVIVTFAVTGSGQTLQQPGTPTDAAGVATGSLLPTAVGIRTVSAEAGAVKLQQTGSLEVTAGDAAPATTEATIDAGTILSFTNITIRTRDQYGNDLTIGGNAGRLVVSVTGAATASPAVTDEGDGTYSARFLRVLPGEISIAITLDGVPIKGSPYVIN